MFGLLDSKIGIWGTGEASEKVWRYIDAAISLYKRINEGALGIAYFIDKNEKKWGMDFYGWNVIPPHEYLEKRDSNEICVIATDYSREIIEQLENKRCYLYYDALYIINQELINLKEEILHLDRDSLSSIAKCIYDNLIRVDRLMNAITYGKEGYQELAKHYKDSEIVSTLAFIYGYKSDAFVKWVGRVMPKCKKREIASVGCYYHRLYNGGVEKVLSMLFPYLLNEGYSVTFFSDEYAPEKEYAIPDNVNRVILNETSYNENLVNRLDEIEAHIRERKIDCVCLHDHIFDKELPYIIGFIKLLGIPVVYELHGVYFSYTQIANGLADFIPSTLKLCDKVIVLSEVNRIFWQNKGIDTVYIQNPIERAYTDGRTSEKLQNEILWVGRINTSDNRVYDIVPIMKRIHEKNEKAHLTVVGTGDEYTCRELKERITESEMEREISLVGYKNNLSQFYSRANILLLTINKGGFPTVITEAMQYGLPIVGYNLDFLELLKEENGCLLSELGDYDSMADNILELLADECLRDKKSDECRNIISKYVNFNVGRAWHMIFDSIVNCSS